MARRDLLVSLVKAGATGDLKLLESTAKCLIAEEKAQNHHKLAANLQSALRCRPVSSIPIDGKVKHLISIKEPSKDILDIRLSPGSKRSVEQLLTEHRELEKLQVAGLEPRHRILLYGPPGNGKTLLAEVIAGSLGLPLITLRYDTVIGSFLGETASRIGKVLDFAKSKTPCVLFFDEFDAIGKERSDGTEVGEIKRVVCTLLTGIDELPSDVILVAATNHHELLDRATWRRFQLRINMPAPGNEEITRLLELFKQIPENARKDCFNALKGGSYSDITEFCDGVSRYHALGDSLDEAVKNQLSLWSERELLW